jgi:hypothetical protein
MDDREKRIGIGALSVEVYRKSRIGKIIVFVRQV